MPIIKAHEEVGADAFDRKIVTDYVKFIEKRVGQGEITQKHYRNLLRGVQRITELHDHGELLWTAPKKASKFKLNEFFESLVQGFLSDSELNPKSRSDATWISRKYFAWLMILGHEDLEDVGATEIQKFMISCSNEMKSSSIHNVKLYMKKLYNFLATNGHAKDNYETLLSFRVMRESKMYPATPPEEVAAILEVINRHTTCGKRDYAMILLGVVCGLRAVDIAKLRLKNIDWQKGEISIVQSKTGKPLILPLTTDVGEAIKDYILNGRQKVDSDFVFLRVRPPYRNLSNGVAIEDMYDSYRLKANLPRDAHDGKVFHSLRRTFGKNSVMAGIPVETVAQVVGDSKIDSLKKYIALDSHHLKECALGLVGIERWCGDE